MDIEGIKSKELSNDCSIIHLYYNKLFATWIAYDKSAYSLRLCVKMRSYNSLRAYSSNFELTYTMISDAVLNRLEFDGLGVNRISEDYVRIENLHSFDHEGFDLWKQRLIDGSNDFGIYHIETSVTPFVPKDEFIPDGMSTFSRYVKRFFDMMASFVALLVFSPLFLIVWALVKAEDGGPAIFKQERIGRFGRPFNIYKFRSMRIDAEKYGPQLSHSGGANDSRLTKVGKFIRATHLDELPQLWNVFIGDMALVGPRPERKFYIDQILEYDRRYEYLYQIRPGVTSYATYYNGYTDTMAKMLRRLEYDLYYLKYRTWWFDIKILIRTFLAIVFGKRI